MQCFLWHRELISLLLHWGHQDLVCIRVRWRATGGVKLSFTERRPRLSSWVRATCQFYACMGPVGYTNGLRHQHGLFKNWYPWQHLMAPAWGQRHRCREGRWRNCTSDAIKPRVGGWSVTHAVMSLFHGHRIQACCHVKGITSSVHHSRFFFSLSSFYKPYSHDGRFNFMLYSGWD